MLTISIIVLTCIISFTAFNRPEVFDKLCFNPYIMHRDRQELFRFVSVGFVHADLGHLIFNMLTLYFFGKALEGRIFSEVQFLLFYVSALVLSGIDEYVKQKNNPQYRACGASGAVAAIMFSVVLFAPWELIYLKFIIPIPFIVFAVGYLIYSYYMDRRGGGLIGHGIHLWGALYGLAFTLLAEPRSLSIFLERIAKPHFL
ncbi:rhomboid family intramembrane serine protease [Nemorincola caseinilytica]|uniref:Rhomboid family intramembrane serine protease n=1 Tax=Nemorincola caseinilytica TaxID=2054315 RepID=A0ABP8NDF9_9BACT